MQDTPCNHRLAGRIQYGRDPSQSGMRPAAGRTRLFLAAALGIAAATVCFSLSCALPSGTQRISVRSLEEGLSYPPQHRRRLMVSDASKLAPLYLALSDHVGLIQIHNAFEWSILGQVVSYLGPAPDFSRGIVIGILSQLGTPLDGGWPVTIRSVRVYARAGLLKTEFNAGCYQPDGAAYLETAYVAGLRSILVVDIDSARFYPE